MNKKEILKDPELVWQKKINDLFKSKSKGEIDIFFKAINLILSISVKNKDMLEIYKILGLDNFIKLINFFDGKTLKIFSQKEFKESFMLSLYYYMREIEKKSWAEIKEECSFEVQTIKYGIRLKKLNEYIKEQLDELFNFEEGE